MIQTKKHAFVKERFRLKLDKNDFLQKERLDEVEYGCKIHIRKMPENKFFISQMSMQGNDLNLLQKWFLGKPIGTKKAIGASEYEIIDIQR